MRESDYIELNKKYLEELSNRRDLEAKVLNFSQVLKKHYEANKDDIIGLIRANYDEYFEITTQRKGNVGNNTTS